MTDNRIYASEIAEVFDNLSGAVSEYFKARASTYDEYKAAARLERRWNEFRVALTRDAPVRDDE